MRDKSALDDQLKSAIRQRIKLNVSPHHVPKKIIAVADIPRTISGKIVELAVRNVVIGEPVKNIDASRGAIGGVNGGVTDRAPVRTLSSFR
jgi:acetoacetyl-CoA synthetase